MTNTARKESILLLNDGTVFREFAPVSTATATGEICFNTGMTGNSAKSQVLIEAHLLF